jgi:hypothetical protein
MKKMIVLFASLISVSAVYAEEDQAAEQEEQEEVVDPKKAERRAEIRKLLEESEQSLREKIHLADVAYDKAAESASVWDKVKARLPFIKSYLEKDSRAGQLSELNERRWLLRDVLWRKKGRNASGRLYKRYKTEAHYVVGTALAGIYIGSVLDKHRKKD